ncbi:EamA family transporter [Brevibacillus borstelensis]|uniref:DMT family transporter n=1 Tax=Brevibacillus borstelensis TaxID=45462 RepID=UPI00148F6E36|nr:EamA family transporter [Brevibacillus borstelensis]MCM3559450.1 DMT family transporter [Brevibacillus borstelensis]NOU53990.1 EamA family transporter [Brevibacillus borstelensis]
MKQASWMLLGAVFLWGLTVVPVKWAMETLHPFSLMCMRLLTAGFILFFFAKRNAKARRHAGAQQEGLIIPWKRMAMLSFTGVAGYFLCNFSGMSLTSGVHASMIAAMLPLFTLSLAALYLKERVTISQWLGLLIGMAGVLMITLQSQSKASFSVLGDLLVLAGEFVFAIYVIQQKRPAGEEKMQSEWFTCLTLLIGGIMVIPFALAEVWMYGPPVFNGKTFACFLFLTLGCTVCAYSLWNQALKTVSAARAGIYLNATPLINVATAILFLHEPLTAMTVLGGFLVLIGVAWAERNKQRNSPAEPFLESKSL